MSGIEVDEEVTGLYNDMKLRSTYKWITFKIENRKKIVVAESRPGNPSLTEDKDKAAWNELANSLTDNNPRYILYDMDTKHPDGRNIKKIFFMFW